MVQVVLDTPGAPLDDYRARDDTAHGSFGVHQQLDDNLFSGEWNLS